VRRLILARHAEAASNLAEVVSGLPPGNGLSPAGSDQARALGAELAGERVDLAVCTRFRRTRETLELAVEGRFLPVVVEPLLDEIDFGSFEGGPVGEYRGWARTHGPGAPCPGGGESRVDAALRFAAGLEALLARPEETVLGVSHALPIRYALDAADGSFPAAMVALVAHATPFALTREAVERAAATLRVWAAAPRFADAPIGG
jgi:2,3-bisphosphoglycerate-dependent phosphoglycerate mutase